MLHAMLLFVSAVLLLVNAGQCRAEGAARDPLRFGVLVPLTGPSATYGRLIRDGVELAVSDLKARGLPVEVYYEDTPVPDARAAAAIHNLITYRKLDALAANFFNPVMVIAAPAVMRARIPAFHTAAADDHILTAGEYILSTNTAIHDEAAALAEYAYQGLGARTAAVLSVTTTWGESYASHFAHRFTELGGRVVYDQTSKLGETDLRTLVLRAKAKNPDVLMAGHFGEGLGLILRAVRELELRQVVLGTYETEDPSVLEVAGEICDNQVRYYVPGDEPQHREAVEFRRRFFERFHYAPRVLAANAYDAVTLAAEALQACGRERRCALELLYRTRGRPGASGVFSMQTTRAAKKEFVLKTIRSGAFSPLN